MSLQRVVVTLHGVSDPSRLAELLRSGFDGAGLAPYPTLDSAPGQLRVALRVPQTGALAGAEAAIRTLLRAVIAAEVLVSVSHVTLTAALNAAGAER